MKKILLAAIAAMSCTLMACGAKAGKDSDATEHSAGTAVSDAASQEAIIRQVQGVYKYLEDARRYFLETPVSEMDPNKWEPVDNFYASSEWLKVRGQVDDIDRTCECGGCFALTDEGPLDPWQYDCWEGEVKVSDIKVTMLGDGTAKVDFNIKDATSKQPVPLRWLMRQEDGKWRVADIIFVKDNDLSLLELMRKYVAKGGNNTPDE